MKNWLNDKTIILTGASSGIGKEMCRLLITHYGANIIGVGRSEEKMLALKKELKDYANKFTYQIFDVSIKAEWEQFAQRLQNNHVCVTLLINNAGIFPSFQSTSEVLIDTIEKTMETNFYSAVYATQMLNPLIPTNKTSGIINICSSAALCTIAGTAPYSASKSALKAYTEALMIEERQKYIGIIYPGTTATELFRNDIQTQNSALDKIAMPAPKMAKKIIQKIYKRKKRAVVGWDAKLMNITAKIAPIKGPQLIRSVMHKSKSKVFKNVFKD